MRQLGQHVVDFLKCEDGPTAVEYAVMRVTRGAGCGPDAPVRG
jgi:hypothetical protein